MKNNHDSNTLFPIFLKLEQLQLLIVGGGAVALEKLAAVLANSPATAITLIAPDVCIEIREIAQKHDGITIHRRKVQACDFTHADLVISAVGNEKKAKEVHHMAKKQGKLINCADKPSLCDFYLGSVVQKGALKIAISTNGKSPTIAKRLREIFQEMLPDKLDTILQNMQSIRATLKGNFAEKVNALDHITRDFRLKSRD